MTKGGENLMRNGEMENRESGKRLNRQKEEMERDGKNQTKKGKDDGDKSKSMSEEEYKCLYYHQCWQDCYLLWQSALQKKEEKDKDGEERGGGKQEKQEKHEQKQLEKQKDKQNTNKETKKDEKNETYLDPRQLEEYLNFYCSQYYHAAYAYQQKNQQKVQKQIEQQQEQQQQWNQLMIAQSQNLVSLSRTTNELLDPPPLSFPSSSSNNQQGRSIFGSRSAASPVVQRPKPFRILDDEEEGEERGKKEEESEEESEDDKEVMQMKGEKEEAETKEAKGLKRGNRREFETSGYYVTFADDSVCSSDYWSETDDKSQDGNHDMFDENEKRGITNDQNRDSNRQSTSRDRNLYESIVGKSSGRRISHAGSYHRKIRHRHPPQIQSENESRYRSVAAPKSKPEWDPKPVRMTYAIHGFKSVPMAEGQMTKDLAQRIAAKATTTRTAITKGKDEIHWMAAWGHVPRALELLAAGEDPLSQDASGRTALHLALSAPPSRMDPDLPVLVARMLESAVLGPWPDVRPLYDGCTSDGEHGSHWGDEEGSNKSPSLSAFLSLSMGKYIENQILKSKSKSEKIRILKSFRDRSIGADGTDSFSCNDNGPNTRRRLSTPHKILKSRLQRLLESRDVSGFTPLLTLVAGGGCRCIAGATCFRILVQAGTNIAATDNQGRNILHHIILQGCHRLPPMLLPTEEQSGISHRDEGRRNDDHHQNLDCSDSRSSHSSVPGLEGILLYLFRKGFIHPSTHRVCAAGSASSTSPCSCKRRGRGEEREKREKREKGEKEAAEIVVTFFGSKRDVYYEDGGSSDGDEATIAERHYARVHGSIRHGSRGGGGNMGREGRGTGDGDHDEQEERGAEEKHHDSFGTTKTSKCFECEKKGTEEGEALAETDRLSNNNSYGTSHSKQHDSCGSAGGSEEDLWPNVLEARDIYGRTPLHFACLRPHNHVINDKDISQRGSRGAVGDAWKENGWGDETGGWQGEEEHCHLILLLRFGASTSTADIHGRTPLHYVMLNYQRTHYQRTPYQQLNSTQQQRSDNGTNELPMI
eukprot:CAMPEP_0175055400 /NCGR_PEP_ID=MMETSP0052_2-20121109/10056_1 /TAXON_ID=51329 ORGANISM="Polytomella parva, Strain SAG 63-3" /NCGR_SAMPLE_ID=MMETSP0052_2 /ASSEMBLY_ACC=CAM_ASM_000194 /LENGTH=1041 /DNA_ID=CAMNT_0016320235 /DNA_START=18 /DNA_END=3140 /DNA_ORIENTATION=-